MLGHQTRPRQRSAHCQLLPARLAHQRVWNAKSCAPLQVLGGCGRGQWKVSPSYIHITMRHAARGRVAAPALHSLFCTGTKCRGEGAWSLVCSSHCAVHELPSQCMTAWYVACNFIHRAGLAVKSAAFRKDMGLKDVSLERLFEMWNTPCLCAYSRYVLPKPLDWPNWIHHSGTFETVVDDDSFSDDGDERCIHCRVSERSCTPGQKLQICNRAISWVFLSTDCPRCCRDRLPFLRRCQLRTTGGPGCILVV